MMKRRRWLWVLLTVLLLAGGIGWHARFASTPSPMGAMVVDLKLLETAATYSYKPLPLDAQGKAEMPFANAAGRLAFELSQGKLRVDTNGDGAIDQRDAPPVDLKPYSEVGIRVAARVGGQAVQYPLSVVLHDRQGEHGTLFVGSRGLLQGSFADKLIRIVDGDVNGRFGDWEDRFAVSSAQTGVEAALISTVQWNQTLTLDGRLFSMELSGGGQQLKLTPYAGPIAEVVLRTAGPASQAQLQLCHVDRLQVGSVCLDESSWFIPGQYRIGRCRLVCNTPRGECRATALEAQAQPLDLKPGPNVVRVGAPFTLDFSAVRDGAQIEFTDVRILGCAGEMYSINVQADDLFAAFIRGDGPERKLADLGFG